MKIIDLKIVKCKGCDNRILFTQDSGCYTGMYCDECHKRYNHLMGQYDN